MGAVIMVLGWLAVAYRAVVFMRLQRFQSGGIKKYFKGFGKIIFFSITSFLAIVAFVGLRLQLSGNLGNVFIDTDRLLMCVLLIPYGFLFIGLGTVVYTKLLSWVLIEIFHFEQEYPEHISKNGYSAVQGIEVAGIPERRTVYFYSAVLVISSVIIILGP
jgi:hypothetical protein